MTQLEELRWPCERWWEWRKAMPRATSRAKENRKFQFRGMSSFISTSFRLPLGQYSLMMATLAGASLIVMPRILQRLE